MSSLDYMGFWMPMHATTNTDGYFANDVFVTKDDEETNPNQLQAI